MLLNITKQGPVAGPVSVQYFTLAGQAKGKLYISKAFSLVKINILSFLYSYCVLQTVEMKLTVFFHRQ